MGQAANDNEELSFIHIAAATANVTRYLNPNEKKEVERDPKTDGGSAEKDREAREREYIEHRLKEIRAWERRVSGLRKDRA